MDGIFNYESKFNAGYSRIIDCILLNILWLICSLPVVTIGASTTALYYTVNKVILHGENYAFREFWKAFKTNLKQSTIIWIIIAALEVLLLVDYHVMKYHYDTGITDKKVYYFFAIMLAIVLVWGIFAFAYTSQFDNTLRQIIRNSFIVIFKSLPNTLIIVFTIGGTVLAVYLVPITVLVLPSFAMWLISYFMNSIYQICLKE